MRQAQAAHIDELVRVAVGGSTRRDAIIHESWRRCVSQHKLDPEVLREARILTQGRLREHRDAMDDFLRTARFGLEMLHRQVSGLGYVLLLTDAEGITVDFIGDPGVDGPLRQAGLYLGADWNEPHMGTCAVGTCIATGEALTVHLSDHFDATHIPLTCTAAPVFDATGALAAVLDISALKSPEPKTSQFLALQLVKSFAHKIEVAHLLSRFRGEWVLKLSASLEFADLEPDYVLAVDSGGRIIGFNDRARRALSPADAAGNRPSLYGRRLDSIVDCRLDDLPRFSHSAPMAERTVRFAAGGRVLFAESLPPPPPRVRPAGGLSALPAPLAALGHGDAAVEALARRAARLADTRLSLLIHGETGSGKEHLAKAVHQAGARAGRPFVAVNCAALPETLIEAELFGYEAGAFTGAASRGRRGLVLEADGGTLFLDEIGDMPLAAQTRLLRVLSEREVTPVGRTRPVPVDVRVIAATHRDLVAAVREGRFREDLYFRLNGAVLTLPPLRARSDLEGLIRTLMRTRLPAMRLNGAALARLMAHDWPGNVRELINALDFAGAVAGDGLITAGDLPDHLSGDPPASAAAAPLAAPLAATLAATLAAGGEQPVPAAGDAAGRLLAVLMAHHWNVSAVARTLGCDRTTVHRQMRRFALVPPNRRN